MKLPTKLSGVTGDSSRGSGETTRRPPSVKASLSVSFGQRAPHRASTRDSSPVRRTVTHDDHRRSYSPSHRSGSREGPDRDRSDRELDRFSRDQDRDRDRDHSSRDQDRDRDIRDYHRRKRDSRDRDYHRSRHSEERRDDRRDRDSSRHRRSSSRHRSRSRSRSRNRNEHRSSPFGDANREKAAAVSSNLAKLKDLYGDVTEKKEDGDAEKLRGDSCAEEVIRLGGPRWR
uniref:Pre-mRNA-splicing factor 38 C-terminal domain-containing protein n=1 Tax=Arundo donax TaxID=35708 RepID=A0A0A9F3E0_ARUDO